MENKRKHLELIQNVSHSHGGELILPKRLVNYANRSTIRIVYKRARSPLHFRCIFSGCNFLDIGRLLPFARTII